MNVCGSRAAEGINLDEYERRLRAAGAQQQNAEDPLLELARLVESSRFGSPGSDRTPADPAAEPVQTGQESGPSIETAALRPAIDEVEDLVPAASEADRDARQDYEFDAPPLTPMPPTWLRRPRRGRPKGWMLKVSALALAGIVMIGAVFWLKGERAGPPRKQPPFIAAAQGPTESTAAQRRDGYRLR